MSRTAAHTARWLVCYDVASGRRRRRLAAQLEARGQRRQRSVFVVEATPDEMPTVLRRCRALLAPTDKLHAWRLLDDGRPLAGSAGPAIVGHWIV
jgi:CRISPR-associated endonuclease Cas2